VGNSVSDDLDLLVLVRELFRQVLHIGAGIFAFGLRWFGFWYGACFAFIAFFWNLLVMPRLFRLTFRESENVAGYSRGMIAYPVSVLLLIVFFPLPIAAAQWAVLSIADGAATFSGALFGRKKVFYNPGKSYIGSAVLFVFSFGASWFAFWFTQSNWASSSFIWQGKDLNACLAGLSLFQAALICLASSVVNTIIESIPLPSWLDDNLTVPLTGAIMMLLVSAVFC